MGNNKSETIIRTIDDNSEVRKSKALLFAQTTPSNLPVPAQRLFLAMLANINEDTKDEDNTFIISGKDIADIAGISPNVVGQQLEDMSVKADVLRQYTLAIPEDDGNILRTGLISSTKYLKGQRAIRVSVDKFLMPHLKKMREQFAISYMASGPMKFRSEYSIRLFEIMNYYLSEGGHYFPIKELRSIFNIPDGKVTKTSVLNQKVVGPAMRDINTFTNLRVEVQYKKEGRTIVGYYFTVKDINPITIEEVKNHDEEFITMLLSPPYNFNKSTLFSLIEKYNIESIKNNFKYAKQHNPKNFSAYLNWAVNNQAYEKQREIEQMEAVKKSLKNDLTPPPQYIEEVGLFPASESENNIPEPNYDKIKESNPALYEIIMRVNKNLEEQKQNRL